MNLANNDTWSCNQYELHTELDDCEDAMKFPIENWQDALLLLVSALVFGFGFSVGAWLWSKIAK